MKRYQITIRWRGYRWNLNGIARDSASLVSGLMEDFGEAVFITVRAV